ncbi:MAG: phosphatase PAP2 family protein [Chloroflexi bacterium]|nr:phosphatase PAP2 family protein [Chloroflexota bacterium]
MISADHHVFHWINGLAGRWDVLDDVMKLLVSDFFMPVILALAAFALWFAGRSAQERYLNQWAFLYAVIGAGFANLFVKVFNQHFYRPRPFIVFPDTHVLFYQPTDPSFPSNAAAYSFALAAGVFLVNRRYGLVIGLGALLFSFARVLNVFKLVVDWALGLVRWWHLA